MLVAFEHGDMRFPFVIGGLWNGVDKIPFDAGSDLDTGKITSCGFVSRTGHKITFHESSSESSIEIVTKGEAVTIVLSETDSELKVTTKGKVTFDAQGDVEIKAGGSMKLEAQGQMTIKGATVAINWDGRERGLHRPRLGLPAAHRRRPAASRSSRASARSGEAIRLILGTSPGERPMRPEFGCRIHDHVFALGRQRHRRVDLGRGHGRRSTAGSRGSTSRSVDVALDADATRRVLYIDIRYLTQRTNDPPQPRLPVLRDPGEMQETEPLWPCPSPTSTIAASRTSSTTPSASSSSAAPSGPTTTCPTRASR